MGKSSPAPLQDTGLSRISVGEAERNTETPPPKKAYRLGRTVSRALNLIIKLVGQIIRISPQDRKFTQELITLNLYSKGQRRNPKDFLLIHHSILTRYPLGKLGADSKVRRAEAGPRFFF